MFQAPGVLHFLSRIAVWFKSMDTFGWLIRTAVIDTGCVLVHETLPHLYGAKKKKQKILPVG